VSIHRAHGKHTISDFTRSIVSIKKKFCGGCFPKSIDAYRCTLPLHAVTVQQSDILKAKVSDNGSCFILDESKLTVVDCGIIKFCVCYVALLVLISFEELGKIFMSSTR
jgi:hypothetical protein